MLTVSDLSRVRRAKFKVSSLKKISNHGKKDKHVTQGLHCLKFMQAIELLQTRSLSPGANLILCNE